MSHDKEEMGPFVYGYSMTIGPDGKPKVREFGNIRSPSLLHMSCLTAIYLYNTYYLTYAMSQE